LDILLRQGDDHKQQQQEHEHEQEEEEQQQQQQEQEREKGSVQGGWDWTQQLLGRLQPLLVTASRSTCYEVRAAALQATARHLDLINQAARHQVSPGVTRLVTQVTKQLWGWLEGEPNHKVCKRLLRVLGLLQGMAPGAAAAAFASSQPTAAVEGQQAGEGSAAAVMAAGGQQQQLPALLQHLQQVMAVAGAVKERESKVHVLRCWGQALQPCLAAAAGTSSTSSSSSSRGLSPGVGALVPAVEAFLVKVKSYSQPWQAEDLRGAAAEALHASRLLCLVLPSQLDTVDQQLVKLAVQGWAVLLQLMEDEEEDVRRQAAAVAHTVLLGVDPAPGSSSTPSAPGQQAGDCVGSTSSSSSSSGSGECGPQLQQQQLPYVVVQQQRVYAFLATCCGQQAGLTGDVLQLLTRTVLEPGDTPELPAVLQRRSAPSPSPATATATAAAAAAAGGGGSGGSTASSAVINPPAATPAAPAPAAAAYSGLLQGAGGRRLFDREADNHYEEVTYTAQCAAAALVRALVTPGAAGEGSRGDGSDTTSVGITGSTSSTISSNGVSNGRRWGSDVEAAVAAVLGPWLGRLVKQLTALLTCLPQQQQREGWVGGVLSHPQVFVLMYRCLLGLAAGAVAWRGAEQMLCQDQQQEGQQQQGGGLLQVVTQLQALHPPRLLQPLVAQLQQALDSCSSSSSSSINTPGMPLQQQQQQQPLVWEAVGVMGAVSRGDGSGASCSPGWFLAAAEAGAPPGAGEPAAACAPGGQVEAGNTALPHQYLPGQLLQEEGHLGRVLFLL
jgi:hypothetical protein